jgi:hypothetical protein
MDISQLVNFLVPFLPYLLKAGEKAAEEAGEKLGASAWESAKTLWAKLRHKKNVEQVAQTAAALPDNQALREALREEIARALEEDPALYKEVTTIFSRAEVGNVEAGEEAAGVRISGENPLPRQNIGSLRMKYGGANAHFPLANH